MERLGYIGMLVVAAVIAVILLILGYRTLTAPKSRQRWAREFWFSVLIIMTIAYSLACSRNPNKLEDTPEWKAVIKRWDKITTSVVQPNMSQQERSKILAEMEEFTKDLQSLSNKGLVWPALVELMDYQLTDLRTKLPFEGTCYSMAFPLPGTKMTKLERLKDRLPLLEESLQKGKINKWIYDKALASIREDLEVLGASDKELLDYYTKLYINRKNAPIAEIMDMEKQHDKEYQEHHKITNEEIDAVQEKAKELIDRAEKSIGK